MSISGGMGKYIVVCLHTEILLSWRKNECAGVPQMNLTNMVVREKVEEEHVQLNTIDKG